MSVENHDVKTVSQMIGSAAATLGIGAIPTGMKRYVTFLRVDNVYAGLQRVYIASLTTAASVCVTATATLTAKIVLNIEADEEESVPPGVPDTEHPLFSIASEHFVGAVTNRGDAYMFMQYYDE
jgi:hypothetical protein